MRKDEHLNFKMGKRAFMVSSPSVSPSVPHLPLTVTVSVSVSLINTHTAKKKIKMFNLITYLLANWQNFIRSGTEESVREKGQSRH